MVAVSRRFANQAGHLILRCTNNSDNGDFQFGVEHIPPTTMSWCQPAAATSSARGDATARRCRNYPASAAIPLTVYCAQNQNWATTSPVLRRERGQFLIFTQCRVGLSGPRVWRFSFDSQRQRSFPGEMPRCRCDGNGNLGGQPAQLTPTTQPHQRTEATAEWRVRSIIRGDFVYE